MSLGGKNMASYPNQIKIIVEKSPANKMRGYSITDRVDEEVASKVLNAGAFKLWRYCARNADGYNFWLSPKAVEEEMKRDQYLHHCIILSTKTC